MNEGILATDARLHIRFGNPAAAALLDLPAEGIEGKALWEVVRDDRFLTAAQEAIRTGERKTLQAGPVRNRHLAVSLSPLPGGVGLVVVVHDVSQAVRYEELRKEFVANVSHELRTPLTAIQGYVETLQDGALRDLERAPAFLDTIAKHTRQLANLVADLLEISRLEGRAELPRRVPVDLARAVRNVLDLLGPAAQRKRQTLVANLPEGLPAVAGDPDYIERAVSNLVDNAVKYTPEGGSIRVSAARRGDRVVIEVADTGIGIPASDLPRVFERFYRVDKSRSRDMGGTGLGLSIVKHIVQAHGGTVEAESEPGKGSVFRLCLPPLS
jgi:two-component system phosphate regulon sensor histidine kinase PhoR